jgi:hypothetical protein
MDLTDYPRLLSTGELLFQSVLSLLCEIFLGRNDSLSLDEQLIWSLSPVAPATMRELDI